ncbi:MAG: putative CoA-binding protein [Gammaproteobacteria bacterium]|jgi:predicted CoA-binding protein
MGRALSIKPLTLDSEIAGLLRNTKSIALEIASSKQHRDSHKILRFLIDYGYDVYPINPAYQGMEIAGRTVYANISDVPVAIDLVDIFRRSESVMPIVSAAIEKDAKAIWMQLGVVNDEAAALANAAGLQVVMDRCPAIDIPRYQSLGLL